MRNELRLLTVAFALFGVLVHCGPDFTRIPHFEELNSAYQKHVSSIETNYNLKIVLEAGHTYYGKTPDGIHILVSFRDGRLSPEHSIIAGEQASLERITSILRKDMELASYFVFREASEHWTRGLTRRDPISTPVFNKSATRILYILPELHWNYEIQKNEVELSRYIINFHKQQGDTARDVLFFREGAIGTIRRSPDITPSEKTADLLMHNSLLSYMDYLLWAGDIDEVYGVESKQLYIANQMAARRHNQSYLDYYNWLERLPRMLFRRLRTSRTVQERVLERYFPYGPSGDQEEFQKKLAKNLSDDARTIIGQTSDREWVFSQAEVPENSRAESILADFGLSYRWFQGQAIQRRRRIHDKERIFKEAARRRDIPLIRNSIAIMRRKNANTGVVNVGAAHIFAQKSKKLDFSAIHPELIQYFQREKDTRFVILKPEATSLHHDFDFSPPRYTNDLFKLLNSRPLTLLAQSASIRLPGDKDPTRLRRTQRDLVQSLKSTVGANEIPGDTPRESTVTIDGQSYHAYRFPLNYRVPGGAVFEGSTGNSSVAFYKEKQSALLMQRLSSPKIEQHEDLTLEFHDSPLGDPAPPNEQKKITQKFLRIVRGSDMKAVKMLVKNSASLHAKVTYDGETRLEVHSTIAGHQEFDSVLYSLRTMGPSISKEFSYGIGDRGDFYFEAPVKQDGESPMVKVQARKLDNGTVTCKFQLFGKQQVLDDFLASIQNINGYVKLRLPRAKTNNLFAYSGK